MKSFTEFHKPIHVILSEHIKTEEPFILRKEVSALEDAEQKEECALLKVECNPKDHTIVIEQESMSQPSSYIVKKRQFREALAIWLQFWGRSALYLCIISFIVGSSLSIAYFYKVEINLNRLLTVYVGCSIALWFFLTPIALYRSLRKVIKT